MLFLGELLALLAGGALLGLDGLESLVVGRKTGGLDLGLLATDLGLLEFALLAQGLFLGGALLLQLFELGVGRSGLGLEAGEQGLLGFLLGGEAVGEAGLFQISHASGRRCP